MPQPTPGDVHVNVPLTNMSVAYLQDQGEFIADKVFPSIPVTKQSDRYFVFPKDQWFRTDAAPRGVSQESAGSGFEIDNTPNYFCNPFALHKDIDDQLRANQDAPLDLDRASAEFVTRALVLKREKDWAAKYFKTSLWTGASDFSPSTKWSATNSTPIKEIRASITSVHKKTGFRPNKLVVARDVWAAIQDSSDFLNRIAYTQTKIVSPGLLASVLEVDEVLIAGAVQNTANEKATAVMAHVFTAGALLVYAPPRPSLMSPSAGYTFSWTGLYGASPQGLRIKRFRMEELASDRIEGEMAYDQKVVATDLGAFFYSCL